MVSSRTNNLTLTGPLLIMSRLLSGANLFKANMKGANLLKAIITTEQLEKARSLKDATVPDGSKHP